MAVAVEGAGPRCGGPGEPGGPQRGAPSPMAPELAPYAHCQAGRSRPGAAAAPPTRACSHGTVQPEGRLI